MDLLAESEDSLTQDSALSIGISRAGARSQTLASWHGGNRWRPVCSRLLPKSRNKVIKDRPTKNKDSAMEDEQQVRDAEIRQVSNSLEFLNSIRLVIPCLGNSKPFQGEVGGIPGHLFIFRQVDDQFTSVTMSS